MSSLASVHLKAFVVVLCVQATLSCLYSFTPATKEGVDIEISSRVTPNELKEHNFPIGEKYKETWMDFYTGSSESGNISVLVKAGPGIIPEILSAISDKNMYKRLYAIAALGYLENKSSISALKAILDDPTEKDYFRGDALEAIYVLDQTTGRSEAQQLTADAKSADEKAYYLRVSKTILESPKDIKLKWVEDYGPSGIMIP